MSRFEAVIFDVGRVLVQIDITSWMKTLFVHMDTSHCRDVMLEIVKSRPVRLFQTGKMSAEEFCQSMQQQCKLDIAGQEFKKIWCDIFFPMPGMDRLIAELSENYKVGLLSDTDPLHWDWLSQFPYIQAVPNPVLSFKTGVVKPDPAMFAAASDAVGVSLKKCLYTDDILENVEGARRAGMTAVQFQNPVQIREQFSAILK